MLLTLPLKYMGLDIEDIPLLMSIARACKSPVTNLLLQIAQMTVTFNEHNTKL